jgi:hypothetical protein
MRIPRKPTASPEALEAFISGSTGNKSESPGIPQAVQPVPAAAPTQLKTRKKPVRQKEVVLRQTFIIAESTVDKLEAYAYYQRMTKKAVLEAALQLFFADKKIRPIPRQEA